VKTLIISLGRYARALSHPKVVKAIKQRLRSFNRTLDPVPLLAEMRAVQAVFGTPVDRRAGKLLAFTGPLPPASDTLTLAKGLGRDVFAGEQRIIHRRMHKPYKK
jgi:hypothetical protein